MSPLLVVALMAIGTAALNALGAHCAYPNTPMGLDGVAECNELGRLRDDLGWMAVDLLMLCVPTAALTAVGGVMVRLVAWRAHRRKSASNPAGLSTRIE